MPRLVARLHAAIGGAGARQRSGLVADTGARDVHQATLLVALDARLIEAVGLDRARLEREFPDVPGHLGGIGADCLDAEWLGFHRLAFRRIEARLVAEAPL